MTRRFVLIVCSVLAVLIVATTVIIVMVVGNLNASLREANYRSCMASSGASQTGNVDTLTGAADRCYKSIYG